MRHIFLDNSEAPPSVMCFYGPHVMYLVILKLINVIHHCTACGAAEYKIGKECCPMCSPGQYVLEHCSRDLGTRCKVCTGSTYTDVPNGLTACLTCTVCDEGNGLRVKRKCIHKADALCKPLPGYYCAETHNESCRKAQKHSSCLPGQYIYQAGTALLNTVCNDCPQETYSNGSLLHCAPHTNCESLGLMTVTQGTESSDAVCSNKPSHVGLIIGIFLFLLLLLVAVISAVIWKKKYKSTVM